MHKLLRKAEKILSMIKHTNDFVETMNIYYALRINVTNKSIICIAWMRHKTTKMTVQCTVHCTVNSKINGTPKGVDLPNFRSCILLSPMRICLHVIT